MIDHDYLKVFSPDQQPESATVSFKTYTRNYKKSIEVTATYNYNQKRHENRTRLGIDVS